MVGTVIVGRARHDHRQLVGLEITERQQIRACLGRRIGTAGLQRKILVGFERRRQTSVDFVGGNVDKPAHRLGSHRLQQIEGSAQIGFENRLRRENAPVDVRFGGEVNHRIRLGLLKNGPQAVQIAEIGLDEPIVWMIGYRNQILEIPGISKLVEIEDLNGWVLKGEAHETRTDKSRASRNEYFHQVLLYVLRERPDLY